jgi:hypothetical protein
LKFKPPYRSRKLQNSAGPGPAAPASHCFNGTRLRRWLTFGAFIATAGSAAAQDFSQEIVEPQALRLQVSNAYVGCFVNGDFQQTTTAGQTGADTYRRLFIGPDFGLDASGSLYHPNFINFTLDGDVSPGYLSEKSNGAGSTGGSGLAVFGNYLANLTVLQEKPYSANFYLSQSYSEQNNDFFNQEEINTLRYGATLGYQAGPIPFTINAWRQQEDIYGGLDNSSTQQESALTLDARNKRASGESTLNYALTNYTLDDIGGHGGGVGQAVALGDFETFGADQQTKLNSTASYNEDNYTDSPIENINASTNLSIEHTPALSSYYDASYNYTDSKTEDGDAKSSDFSADLALQHQLYESLTSTVLLQGLYDSSTDNVGDNTGGPANSTSQTIQFGGGVTEQYTKHVTPKFRVSVGLSAIYQHTIQNDTGDSVIATNESHTFSSQTDSFFLSLPDVNQSSIIITDSKGTLPAYQLGIDYLVTENGALTMIRRTATSSIPENSKVLVTYSAAAAPSGQYDTLNSSVNVRFDFWNGLLGVYGRIDSVQNFGVTGAYTPFNSQMDLGQATLPEAENISDYVFGADTTWRWLHAGAEYENYNSTFSSYTSARLFESLSFKPDNMSTLNFNFNEALIHYVNNNTQEQDYSVIAQYHRGILRNLRMDLETGIDLRRGAGEDQTLIAVRPGLEFNVGELTVKMGYSLEYSDYLSATVNMEQMFFIDARRAF